MSQLALAALAPCPDLKLYTAAIQRACEIHPPPYGERWFGDEYRRRARDPSWFASLLVSNADLEGYSASQLWVYAATVADLEFRQGLRRHALDEARHSRMFTNLLFTIFPKVDSAALRTKLIGMSPQLRRSQNDDVDNLHTPGSFDELLNSSILINIYEIKALILEYILIPILLAYCPARHHAKVDSIMKVLISDEIQHIRYSAEFIQTAVERGYRDYVMDAMSEFQETLNIVTEDEVKHQIAGSFSGARQNVSFGA